MLILVTNDDGIQSPGLSALAETLGSLGDVFVVAPDRERSASGHSLTLDRALRMETVREGWIAVDGTPTDCVKLGVGGILPRRPDLVVAGINLGANVGEDVTYSGTVAAALEGTLLGIASVAVSLATREDPRFDVAARTGARIARLVADRGLPPGTLLNVNVPNLEEGVLQGIRVTHQGDRRNGGGTPGDRPAARNGNGLSDYEAVEQGWVSVTPLQLDLTHHAAVEVLRRWPF